MKTNQNVEDSPIGLDIGTSRIVMAERANNDFQYTSQLNAFVSIPFSKMTASMLSRDEIPHTLNDSEIIVYGNESERLAALLDVEVRRPMTRGTLDAKETGGLDLIADIISLVVGDPSKPGQKLWFSVPAAPLGSAESLTYHETTMHQLLGDLGYRPKALNEGIAVIYGELEASNYTGIGISCGGGLCNVAMAYLSVPVLSFSVSKAGDFIDSSVAAVTGERANRIRILKEESFHLNNGQGNKLDQVITVYYDDMIDTLINGIREAFANTLNLPRIGRPKRSIEAPKTREPDASAITKCGTALPAMKGKVPIGAMRTCSIVPVSRTARASRRCT